MALKRSEFVSYEKVTPFSIEIGDNSTALAVGRGEIRLPLDRDGTPVQCKRRDVRHVPSFVYNLVSVSAWRKLLKMLATGFTVTAKWPANITNQITSMINRANTATAAYLDVSYYLINP